MHKEKEKNPRLENITFAGEEKKRIIRKLSEEIIEIEEEEIDASQPEFGVSKKTHKEKMQLELEISNLQKHESLKVQSE